MGSTHTYQQDPAVTVSGPTIVIIPEYKNPDPGLNDRGVNLYTVIPCMCAGLTPVFDIDGRIIGDGTRGPMVDRLQALYGNMISAECQRGRP